jgi:excisionase family DNA binding protein
MTAEVLTTREAASFLKVHEKTLCRLARQGKIPGNKIGGEWRFMKNDLVRWIQSGAIQMSVSAHG